MSSKAFFSLGQSLPSNALTHDTYSVTFDTRKAWGSWEAASTLQSKEEILRAPSRTGSRLSWAATEPSEPGSSGSPARGPSFSQSQNPFHCASPHLMQSGYEQLPASQVPC